MLKRLIILTFATVFGLAGAAQAEKRVALVIGNSQYQATAPLKNPENDAKAVAAKLGGLGFDVVEGYNLSYDAMRDKVRDFAREASDADLTIFYYAGHGIAVDSTNYMVPIDARMDDPIDWEFEVFALTDVLRHFERSSGPSLVFLDACRDNPMAQQLAALNGLGTRSLSTRGLSPISTQHLGTRGSVIAYATEPGQVAQDGTGRNSPFTTALLEHIGTTNTDFASLTSRITRDVLAATDNQQRPRFDVSLTGPLILNAVHTPEAAAEPQLALAAAVTPLSPGGVSSGGGKQAGGSGGGSAFEIEKIVFETAKESGDAADYQAYLDAYPNGVFATLARNAISRLEEDLEEPAVVASATGAAPAIPVSTTRVIDAPLRLRPTPEGLAQPASQVSEAWLGLTRDQRREVQGRLNVAGHNVGGVDGIFGNGTRRGVSSWQAANGFPATGYLNTIQHQMLVANTEADYRVYLATRPAPAPKASGGSGRSSSASTRSRTSSVSTSSRRAPAAQRSNSAAADAAAAAIFGAAVGAILSRR
ncbi:caspase family protein [Allosediminivita pacifica]|uniref:Putative caspase-like protein n=1 Tax=Allosediminivita pacifica TaxID=1267769 RepID=A0A2T6AUG8_9RHOB|nr:caspase family protein [Allosediminivita pacifica]PTX47455.1 putative caspase-like protein [Allosediminivita pacifica]GGB14338.1 peptidase [Allosediminivita pacifica]